MKSFSQNVPPLMDKINTHNLKWCEKLDHDHAHFRRKMDQLCIWTKIRTKQ